MPKLTATFERHPDPTKAETKNTYRYVETDDSPAAGAIGSLYVSKLGAKMALGGHPERITVTVEAPE